MRNSSLFLLALGLLAQGCLGFAPLRLVSVETENGDARTLKEVQYHDDGRIEEIETTRGGNFAGRLEFVWEGGRLSSLVYAHPEDGDIDIDIEWDGDLLTRMEADGSGTDYVVNLEYDNGDPRFPREHESIITQPNGNTTTLRRTHDYDEGRLVESNSKTIIASGNNAVTFQSDLDLRWSDDGLPEEADLTDTGLFGQSRSRDVEYKYDEERRIEEAEYSDGSSVAVGYDREGRIDEVEVIDDGDRVVHTLEYEDGSSSGFVFVAPGLPAGMLFDLLGRAFEHPEIMSNAYFPVP